MERVVGERAELAIAPVELVHHLVAGITVAFHSGDAGYKVMDELYGGDREFRAFAYNPLHSCLSFAPVADTLAALICHGVFERHPGVRVATIECGSEWVTELVRRMKKAYGQMPTEFKRDPVEQFQHHCYVAPYYEDDILKLKEQIGTDHVLFGSDYPHAEGLAEPTDFIRDLDGFAPAEVRSVMRDNAMGLLQAA